LFYGAGFFEIATRIVRDGSRLFGIPENFFFLLLALLLFIRMAAGAVAGLLARSLGEQIRGRLRRAEH